MYIPVYKVVRGENVRYISSVVIPSSEISIGMSLIVQVAVAVISVSTNVLRV